LRDIPVMAAVCQDRVTVPEPTTVLGVAVKERTAGAATSRLTLWVAV
jgi:hypothetical protein